MALATLARKKIRVWNRGQVTIPRQFREDLGITDEAILNVIKLGQTIFLTPKDVSYPKLSREFRSIIKEKNITQKDLLKELRKVRKEIFKEQYGTAKS